jgi:hypothetical protein
MDGAPGNSNARVEVVWKGALPATWKFDGVRVRGVEG